MAFAGSDLLPARPQSFMRQRVKVILPVRAEELIGGKCRPAIKSLNVCVCLRMSVAIRTGVWIKDYRIKQLIPTPVIH